MNLFRDTRQLCLVIFVGCFCACPWYMATSLAQSPTSVVHVDDDENILSRSVESVCRYIWGKHPPSPVQQMSTWTISAVSPDMIASEVPFATCRGTGYLLTGQDLPFTDKPEGRVTRTIRAFVSSADFVVLKLIIVDDSRNPDAPEKLEPLGGSFIAELRTTNERWIEAVVPETTCVMDALRGVFDWGLSVKDLRGSTRIVVHAVKYTSAVSTPDAPHRSIWSVDFRDGSVSPKAPPAGLRVKSQLRYLLDLNTCKPLCAHNKPDYRGCYETAMKSLDEELERLGLPKRPVLDFLQPAQFAPQRTPTETPPPAPTPDSGVEDVAIPEPLVKPQSYRSRDSAKQRALSILRRRGIAEGQAWMRYSAPPPEPITELGTPIKTGKEPTP